MTGPVLFAGGTGVVGRPTINWFRQRHPRVPVLVGGRDMRTAGAIAEGVGAARAVPIDLGEPRLGLEEDVSLGAVVMLAPDDAFRGLRLAQELGVPYLNISTGLTEVGPELALLAHHAKAAPVVLASHWLGGAALFLALDAAKPFETVRSIQIGAVIDEQDAAGPTALEDMKRVHDSASTAMAFEGGRRVWLSGDSAKGQVNTVDGRQLAAEAFSTFDVASLYTATEASDVRFDLLTGLSSSRRRGDGASAEIVVEIDGEADGAAMRSRSTLEFGRGQASLTGLSVVLSLSAALGLNSGTPAAPGLHLPELLSDPEWFLDELRSAGAVINQDFARQDEEAR